MKCKKFCKVFGAIFLLFPALYLLTNPYAFPWFIFPCGVMLIIAGLTRIKRKEEKLQSLGLYGVSIHSLFYIVLNGIFIICDIRRGGFPLGIIISILWGAFLVIHLLRTKFKDSKKNNPFKYHLILFIAFTLVLFITYSFVTCRIEYGFYGPNAHYNGNYGRYRHGHHHGTRHLQNFNPHVTQSQDINKHPTVGSQAFNHHHHHKRKAPVNPSTPAPPPVTHTPPTTGANPPHPTPGKAPFIPGYKHHHGKKRHGGKHHHGKRHKWWKKFRHYHHSQARYQKVVCHRSLGSMFFFFIPVYIWGFLLFIHYLKHNGKTSFTFCCVTLSFGQPQILNNQEENIQPNQQLNVPQTQPEPINIPQENVTINQETVQPEIKTQVNLEQPSLYPKVL